MHGQDSSFRIRKWVIICIILAIVHSLAGLSAVWIFIKISIVFGFFIHFLFRYHTHGWTKPWWIMKKVIKTPYDE